jgi:hypothetical protein
MHERMVWFYVCKNFKFSQNFWDVTQKKSRSDRFKLKKKNKATRADARILCGIWRLACPALSPGSIVPQVPWRFGHTGPAHLVPDQIEGADENRQDRSPRASGQTVSVPVIPMLRPDRRLHRAAHPRAWCGPAH